LNTHTLCLCGSGIEYQQCCELFHSDEKIPATAEALMRSRYTAYAMHNASYLQETWDTTKRPEKIDFSREKIDWLRLEITDTKKGGIKDSKGVVSFKAFYRQDGEEHVMNEISRFTKINGRWFYLDGVIKSIGKVGLLFN
jgi:SEC-C motif-containing protein